MALFSLRSFSQCNSDCIAIIRGGAVAPDGHGPSEQPGVKMGYSWLETSCIGLCELENTPIVSHYESQFKRHSLLMVKAS